MALSDEHALKHFVDFGYHVYGLVEFEVLVGCLQFEAHLFDHVVECVYLLVELGDALFHDVLVGVVVPEVL